MTIADEMLFIKVAADVFIYAWRLPYYRKFLKVVLTRAGRQTGNEATEMVTMAWLLLILTINIQPDTYALREIGELRIIADW